MAGESLILVLTILVGTISMMAEACVSPTIPADLCGCSDVNGIISIDCRQKNLTQIPQFTVTNVVYDRIDFSNSFEVGSAVCAYLPCNKITNIPGYAFKNISVKEINLLKNPIADVDIYAFDGEHRRTVRILSMQGDGNVLPPYDALELLVNLTSLHLVNYKQTELNKTTLLLLRVLTSLTLEKFNVLTTIQPSATLSNLVNLEELTLVDLPAMRSIPVPAIQQLTTLKKIELKNLGITEVFGETFSTLNVLEEISISQNTQLRKIASNSFTGVHDTLTHLFVKTNDILTYEGQFLNLPWSNLSHLDLSYNKKLGAIADNSFQTLSNLEYLTMQDIGLTNIHAQTFTGLGLLHTLDISYNTLTSFGDGAFQSMANLVELRINHQSPSTVINLQPSTFLGIETTLEILLMENNLYDTSQLWTQISKLINLKELNIDATGLAEIPDRVFETNVKLEKLHLSNNNIQSINQATFFGPKSTLRDIYIQSNMIQSINNCLLSDFPTKPKLHLSGNPLHCDCELAWLHDWVHQQPDTEAAAIDVGECAAPPNLANKTFDTFSKADMCPGGPNIPQCPNLYITTTTTTTTTTTPSTRTSTTTKTTPPPTPAFTFSFLHSGVDYITLAWEVTGDKTYLEEFSLQRLDTLERIPLAKSTSSYTVHKLQPQTSYTFCLSLKIHGDLRVGDQSCVYGSTTAPLTTTMEPTADAQKNNVPIIAGAAGGGVLLVILILVIVYVLLKANKAQHQKPPIVANVSYQPKQPATLPHAGDTTKRFAKNPHKKGASPENVEVKIISNGDMTNNGRISAGSYQFLNEKGVDKTPMPSTSNGGYVNATLTVPDNYANSVDDRPLPKAPNGTSWSDRAKTHGYVNDGFTNKPETSTNEYSEVSEGKWI